MRCETTSWDSAVGYAGRTFILVASLVVPQALYEFPTGGAGNIYHLPRRSPVSGDGNLGAYLPESSIKSWRAVDWGKDGEGC